MSEMKRGADTVPAGYGALSTPSDYSELVGPIYDFVGDEDVAARGFRVAQKHINRAGIVHGGMLMSFADLVLSRGVRKASAGPGVTVRMTTEFLGPAHLGDWVEGEARVSRTTKTLVFVDAEIRANGHIILTASGVFRRIRRRRGMQNARETADG